jgi:hypothetical protein
MSTVLVASPFFRRTYTKFLCSSCSGRMKMTSVYEEESWLGVFTKMMLTCLPPPGTRITLFSTLAGSFRAEYTYIYKAISKAIVVAGARS